jgi:hypothetical protein
MALIAVNSRLKDPGANSNALGVTSWHHGLDALLRLPTIDRDGHDSDVDSGKRKPSLLGSVLARHRRWRVALTWLL